MRVEAFSQPRAPQPLSNRPGESSAWEDLLIRLLSFSVRVSSNSPSVLREIASLYPANEGGQRPSSEGASVELDVEERRTEDNSVRYLLRQQGREVAAFGSASDALLYVSNLINTNAAMSLRSSLLLHAGVVAHGDAGVLLPGASGAGKSTLVAALCLNGFRYLSDDLGVLEIESLVLRPFLKAICLKEGGWTTLVAAFGMPAASVLSALADGQTLRYLAAPDACSPSASVRVRYVMVPFRRPGPVSLTRCSRAQTLAHLAQHSLNLPRHGPAGIDALARLVEAAECYIISYQDLRDAVEKVSSLVGHWHSQQASFAVGGATRQQENSSDR